MSFATSDPARLTPTRVSRRPRRSRRTIGTGRTFHTPIERRTRPCQRAHARLRSTQSLTPLRRRIHLGHWRGPWFVGIKGEVVRHQSDKPETDRRRAGHEAAIRPRDHRADGSAEGSGPHDGPGPSLGSSCWRSYGARIGYPALERWLRQSRAGFQDILRRCHRGRNSGLTSTSGPIRRPPCRVELGHRRGVVALPTEAARPGWRSPPCTAHG